MGKSQEAIKAIVNSVKMAIDESLRIAKFDVTVLGKIDSIISANSYRIEICGSYFTVTDNRQFAVNDIVYILIPKNNYSDLFILMKKGG